MAKPPAKTDGAIDRGTLALIQHPTPGPQSSPFADQARAWEQQALGWGQQAWHDAEAAAQTAGRELSAADEAFFKQWAILHAYKGSYAMEVLPGQGGGVVSGQYLRMYLEHKLDPNVVAEGGKIIVKCLEYQELELLTFQHLQTLFATQFAGKKPTATDVEAFARAQGDIFLKERRRTKGIAFRSGGANAIIGGVGGTTKNRIGVEVRSASATLDAAATTPNTTVFAVVLQVNFADTYDFENDRSDQPEYDRYRKELADMLVARRFLAFQLRVRRDELFPPLMDGHASRGHVFASFMYAIEKYHWTPGGLEWDITLPLKGPLGVATSP